MTYASERPGDVRDSLADITKAVAAFGYAPTVELRHGIEEYVGWLRDDAVSAGKRGGPV